MKHILTLLIAPLLVPLATLPAADASLLELLNEENLNPNSEKK